MIVPAEFPAEPLIFDLRKLHLLHSVIDALRVQYLDLFPQTSVKFRPHRGHRQMDARLVDPGDQGLHSDIACQIPVFLRSLFSRPWVDKETVEGLVQNHAVYINRISPVPAADVSCLK